MKRYLILSLALLTIYGCSSIEQNSKTPQTNFDKELAWWKDAHYGMFIHWGISSLMGQEISWSRNAYGPEKYDRLAQRFNPKDFDAEKWVSIAENAGMKYMVLTTKHHDGFCLWDSKVNSHNIVNTPYGKDICAQLAEAAHKHGMRLGWYFSVREFSDSTCNHETLNQIYVEKMKGELKELLTNYGKIDLLWFDYEGCPASEDPQIVFDFCRELQPDIIINNRLYPLHPEESHAYTGSVGMYATPECFIGNYSETPWESCDVLGHQWSIRFNDTPKPSKDMIWRLMGAVGGNGNYLLNVGPDSLGVIAQDFIDTLNVMNNWIKSNDGVLYGTKGGPWKPTQNYFSTRKDKIVNIIVKDGKNDVVLPYNTDIDFEKAYIASTGEPVQSNIKGDTIIFSVPESQKGASNIVIRLDMKSDANKIEAITPFSTSGSLAYMQKATASSSLSDVYMHNPASAFDDDPRTCWIAGRRKDFDSSSYYGHYIHFGWGLGKAVFDDQGTLEVDLGEYKDVKTIKVNTGSKIANTYIEYENNEKWMTADVAYNLKSDTTWQVTLNKPINARNWRLRMSGSESLLMIKEFQIFDK